MLHEQTRRVSDSERESHRLHSQMRLQESSSVSATSSSPSPAEGSPAPAAPTPPASLTSMGSICSSSASVNLLGSKTPSVPLCRISKAGGTSPHTLSAKNLSSCVSASRQFGSPVSG